MIEDAYVAHPETSRPDGGAKVGANKLLHSIRKSDAG